MLEKPQGLSSSGSHHHTGKGMKTLPSDKTRSIPLCHPRGRKLTQQRGIKPGQLVALSQEVW